MKSTIGIATLLSAAFLLSLAAPPSLAAERAKRVALVVGNGAYEHTLPLGNPVNDAVDVAAALKGLGFRVIEGHDLDRGAFEAKRDEFVRATRGTEAALFFYAGHGIQVAEENYLLPVDAELKDEVDLRKALKLQDFLDLMSGSANLVFLDACRDNPLAQNLARSMGASRSGDVGRSRGLGQVDAGSGTLIAYATQPGGVADDGTGQNSPFTTALLRHIAAPGRSVNDLLTAVTGDVATATDNRQQPWTHSSLRTPFYFVPPKVVDTTSGGKSDVTTAPDPVVTSGSQQEMLYWESIKDSNDPADFEAYLEDYPEGEFKKLAQNALKRLGGPVQTGGTESWKTGEVFRDCAKCPEMVVVPAGSFEMGSPASEEGRDDDEGPQRRVTISRPFAVGKYEVTFAEWDACVVAGACRGHRHDEGWGRGRRPVVNVNWNDARAYAGWLSRQTDQEYRLLSESEWEYAARAGTPTRYHWGDSVDRNLANCDGCGSRWDNDRTAPAGSFPANGFGLHDMHGNVWEWVEDCWHDSYSGRPSDSRSWTTGGNCSRRVLRGGSWVNEPGFLRSANRGRNGTGNRLDVNGFRVARTLAP